MHINLNFGITKRELEMKKKTECLIQFLNDLHEYIIKHPLLSKKTNGRPEREMQREIRHIIVDYLKEYYEKNGFKFSISKASRSFYWEGQDQSYPINRTSTFGAKNYPDFVIKKPYTIAVEYKQGASGSLVKRGIGQSIMHTLSGDYDYVYYLFFDQNKNKKIKKSLRKKKEIDIRNLICENFNVFMEII